MFCWATHNISFYLYDAPFIYFNIGLNILLTIGCLYAIPTYFYMYPITDLRVIIVVAFECVVAYYLVALITKALDNITEYRRWKREKHG